MPKPTDYDKTHLRNLTAICTRIDRIFQKAAEEAAKIGVTLKTPLPEDKVFRFEDYPATQKQIERLLNALQESMQTTIVNGVRSAWTLSNNKNNDLVSRVFGDHVRDLTKEQYKRYFSTNANALEAFIQRKEHGLNLSDNVWRYTNAFKHEIELGLDLGIRTGESAAKMTRSLRQYLKYPDKLFRRVKDKHGLLQLSKAAKEFHPGRGVYRSSYKNARRLAATETNMAYRTSDHLRWQQMDFVVGVEIKLSNNHTLNGMPLTDICDELKGRYPKTFKFVGWHPHCRCHAVSILKTEDEMRKDTQRILEGKKPEKGSENEINDVPDTFKDWVAGHSARIKKGSNLPYFVKDNIGMVRPILALEKPIKIGNKEWTLKELIAECRIEPTENGKIYVHPGHGKNELAENLDFARWRAEQFSEEVVLLPNPQGVKSADSYNITRGVLEEYKRGHTASVNAIDRLLRDGAKQADCVILEIDCDVSPAMVADAMNSRLKRSGIKEVRLKISNAEAVYTRDVIIKDGFKLKPEDFHNVSAFRSRGSALEKGVEPNIVANVDAKVANFFGINKKTSQKIAIKRHAKRDAAKIQQAWNARRIANIEESVKKDLLPKEGLTWLSALKQEELNARILLLQKTAARHAARTSADVNDIQFKWSRRRIKRINYAKVAPGDTDRYNALLNMTSLASKQGFNIDEFNAQYNIIMRHARRAPSDIEKIRQRWDARYIEMAGEKKQLAAMRKALEKQKITDIADVQRIMDEFYNQFPEEFNYTRIKFIGFDRPPKGGRFTMGYSKLNIEIAFNSNKGWKKESPLEKIIKALDKLRTKKQLNIEQLRSVSTIVHELLHQKAAKHVQLKPHGAGDFKRTAMETMNELASRATTVRFIRRLGGNTNDVAKLITKGDGYPMWVKRVLKFCEKAGVNPERIGQEWAQTLTTESYDTMDAQLYAFFKKHADKKGFTQSMDEVLAAFEDEVSSQKWNAMMKKWFP